MKNTRLLVMAAGIGSRFGGDIKQLEPVGLHNEIIIDYSIHDAVNRHKNRKQAVAKMKENCTEENLWQCIIAFQCYPFYTFSGLPFSYTLKIGRNGKYTKELFIDRRENSKSLAWSSVKIVFEKAIEKPCTVFDRPKAIADVRGVSYSYSLLWRFGVIIVPEEVEKKLRGNSKSKKA